MPTCGTVAGPCRDVVVFAMMRKIMSFWSKGSFGPLVLVKIHVNTIYHHEETCCFSGLSEETPLFSSFFINQWEKDIYADDYLLYRWWFPTMEYPKLAG